MGKLKEYRFLIILVFVLSAGSLAVLLILSKNDLINESTLGGFTSIILTLGLLLTASFFSLLYMKWFSEPRTSLLSLVQRSFFWLLLAAFLAIWVGMFLNFTT